MSMVATKSSMVERVLLSRAVTCTALVSPSQTMPICTSSLRTSSKSTYCEPTGSSRWKKPASASGPDVAVVSSRPGAATAAASGSRLTRRNGRPHPARRAVARAPAGSRGPHNRRLRQRFGTVGGIINKGPAFSASADDASGEFRVRVHRHRVGKTVRCGLVGLTPLEGPAGIVFDQEHVPETVTRNSIILSIRRRKCRVVRRSASYVNRARSCVHCHSIAIV